MVKKERNVSENEFSESDSESSSDNSISEQSVHFPVSSNKRDSIEARSNSDSDSSIDDGLKQSSDAKKNEKKRDFATIPEIDQDEKMTSEDETSDDTADPHDKQIALKKNARTVHRVSTALASYVSFPDENELDNVIGYFYEVAHFPEVLQPKGLIMIKERIDVPDFGNIVQHEPKHHILPSELKQRHPLFGSDYKQELEKRNAALRKNRKKTKKRKRSIGKTGDEYILSHKKKKRKLDNEDLMILENYGKDALLSGNLEEEDAINMNDASGHFHKKKKKKHKNKEDFNEYESETVHKKKKKKHKNKDDFNEYESALVHKKNGEGRVSEDERTDVEQSNITRKKKKNKFKKREESGEFLYDEEIHSQNSKSAKKNTFENTGIESIEFPFEEQDDNSQRSVKKKKKHKKEKAENYQ
ncbi:hypothetical protein C0J52_05198 [Blattella germanica]|nr:hypothetical protein C0J52_05198 [Blattella germanica]